MGDWGPTPPTYGATSAPVATGTGWEGWFQNLTSQYLGAKMNLRAMENIQRGETAYYREGQPATAATVGGIPTGLLVLGALAVVAVMAAKD